jgi:hypothetical protein
VWRQLIPAQIAAARRRVAAEHAAARGSRGSS